MVRDAVPLGECARALVVKRGQEGDARLAAPVVSVLKAHAPHMEIDVLHEGTLGLGRVLQLRKRGYDLMVNLSDEPRTAWLSRLLGARWRVGPAMPERGRFWKKSFTHLYPRVPRRPPLELDLDALRRIGVQP
jgi:heptosyltransferase-3